MYKRQALYRVVNCVQNIYKNILFAESNVHGTRHENRGTTKQTAETNLNSNLVTDSNENASEWSSLRTSKAVLLG